MLNYSWKASPQSAQSDWADWGRQTPGAPPAQVLGADDQLNCDCLDPVRGLVAVDAARSRLVVIEKSRLAASGCAAHAGKAPMHHGST